ncbi:MAG: ABC transporter substrate-binding protein [Gemmatimonas sp.]|nr:ABC transporter substrate-binding protein [Gemmatimonas sp.]
MISSHRLLALGLIVVTVGACSDEASEGTDADGTEVVNIGFSGPLSGGAAFYGQNVVNGLTMAIDELNQAGDIEVNEQAVRFELVTLDDRYLPNESATNVRRLLQQSRTPVIFVPHVGGILAVQPMSVRPPEFLLSAYSSDPRILEAANPLTLMIPPRYDGYFEPFVGATMEAYGNRLGVLPTNTSYGRAWAEGVTEEWRRQGGEVLGDHSVDYNTTTDFAGPVTQTLADAPDVILVGGPSQPTALIVHALRQQGYEGGFIVMDQAKFEEMEQIIPRTELEGSVGVYPLEAYTSVGTVGFVERFHEKFGRERLPTSEVALNYFGMHIVAQAMELAGTVADPQAIRGQLTEAARQLSEDRKPYEYDTVTKEGHLTGDVVTAFIQNGEYTAIPIPRRSGRGAPVE